METSLDLGEDTMPLSRPGERHWLEVTLALGEKTMLSICELVSPGKTAEGSPEA